MLGRSHFVSGAVAFEATSFYMHYTLPQVVTGMTVVTCAALLPDMDHPKATASNTFGPVTRAFARTLAKVMGGHRAGTHSILGILMLGAITQACVMHRHALWADSLLSLILIVTLAAGVRIFRIKGVLDDTLPVPIVLAVVFLTNVDLRAVPPALMLGCAVHVLGDCMTNSGCPVFWPITKDRLKFGLFKTGKRIEKLIVFPMLMVSMFGLAVYRIYTSIPHH